MPHKFKVGEALNFTGVALLSGLRRADSTSSACKVTRLMPTENGPPVYRIQCDAETFERVAKETDLG